MMSCRKWGKSCRWRCVPPSEPFHRMGAVGRYLQERWPRLGSLWPSWCPAFGGRQVNTIFWGVPVALPACSVNVMAASSFLGVTVQSQPREAAGHGGLGAAEVHRLCHQRDPSAEPTCSWRISNCTQDPWAKCKQGLGLTPQSKVLVHSCSLSAFGRCAGS